MLKKRHYAFFKEQGHTTYFCSNNYHPVKNLFSAMIKLDQFEKSYKIL